MTLAAIESWVVHAAQAHHRTLFAVVLALGLLATRRARPPGSAAVLDGLVAAALALVAALTTMALPLLNESPILRIAYARYDIFADWNHPFLPYLLNAPARWSDDVRTVRLGPISWSVVCVVLTQRLGFRLGGRTAGIVAAAALAIGTPRRTSIVGISDWDLAGCFLVGMALAFLRLHRGEERDGPGLAFELGALAWLGAHASWLMAVPIGLLCLALAARVPSAGPRAALTLAGPVLACLITAPEWLQVHRIGASLRSRGLPIDGPELVRQLVEASLFGDGALAGTLALLGLVLVLRQGLFGAFLVSVPMVTSVGVFLAWLTSLVSGGYYGGLSLPFQAAAAGLAAAALGSRVRSPALRLALGALIVAGLRPADVPSWHLPNPEDVSLARLPDAYLADPGDLGVDWMGAYAPLVATLARRGLGSTREVIGHWSDATIGDRWHELDLARCCERGDCVRPPEVAWVLVDLRARGGLRACAEALVADCDTRAGVTDLHAALIARCPVRAAEPAP